MGIATFTLNNSIINLTTTKNMHKELALVQQYMRFSDQSSDQWNSGNSEDLDFTEQWS